ncbi:MAG: valine--tRNA ligase [Candidatus Omnitrophota bacterium]|nr:MAG: valine--tRNA ligase [Candidatus Omnitrophota bacterium]
MEIPSKYDPKPVEEKIYQKWLNEKKFAARANPSKRPFCIVIPPPNVTGILHMGHALNNTIQDVLIRFRRMQGYESLWMPGTDHAGIATQNVVEKELAKERLKKEDIGREKFLERLWDWTDKHGSTIIEQLKKLGASCDWDRTRFTMDKEYSEAVKEVFIKLYEKELIYRGNYIINWCPRCETALSDEESPHKEIDGWLYYIRYPVEQGGGKIPSKFRINYIIVATTRPETMLGDTAVAINPRDTRYQYLKNAKVILPIVERELKVVEDEAVDPEFGTGVVKVTPAHDPADFQMGKKHNLEFINIMNPDSTLNQNVPEDFIGMDRFEARQAILEVLQEKKLIEKREPYRISAGHCYRCHTIIEPRVSPQWFVRMRPLAQGAIKVVEEDKVTFLPQRWKKVYLNWVHNIQDWCISRQIWWGHRLPVYYCKDCREGVEEESKKGVIVAKEKPPTCPACGSSTITQDNDVLDTWFSSWLWPFATFHWPQSEHGEEKAKADLDYFYPTNVLVTASEILFFWVARMIMAGMEFMNQIPFDKVLIHGTVRDAKGIKMSKSLGNIIDPLDIIEKFGADALRFSLMLLAASGSDVYLSDEKFLVGRNFCNKIWNATRLCLLKIKENKIKVSDLELKELEDIDKWCLQQLDETINQATKSLQDLSINDATKKAYDFFWHTFCDWYLEIIKDNFTAAKTKVLLHSLVTSMKLLHPVMPFITQEVFTLIKEHSSLKLEDSLVSASWPKPSNIAPKESEAAKLNLLVETIRQIRNIKTDLGLGAKKLHLEIKAGPKAEEFLRANATWIMRLSASQSLDIKPKLARTLYKNALWEINLGIEDIDAESFVTSLEKKISKIQTIFEKASVRLTDQRFLDNASPDTVENEKAKFEEISLQLKRLQELRKAFMDQK